MVENGNMGKAAAVKTGHTLALSCTKVFALPFAIVSGSLNTLHNKHFVLLHIISASFVYKKKLLQFLYSFGPVC